MRIFKKEFRLLISACLYLFFIGCAIPKRASLPQLRPLPETYPADSGKSNIAILPRDSFFRDPYLKKLMGDVLQNNPDMNIALQRIAEAGAWLKMSKGALLPAVGLNAAAGATKYGKYTMEGVGNFDTNLSPNIDEDQRIGTNPTPDFWLGLNASWEIDVWGRLKELKKSARHRFIASLQGADLVKTMLVAQTAIFYYELVTLDKEHRVLQENIRIQEQAAEIVAIQQEAGRATALAVEQFRAQLLNTKASLRQVAQQRKELENQLNALAGRYEGTILRDTILSLNEALGPDPGTGIPAGLLLNRPDIKQAESKMLAAHADLAAARAAFFPAVNISAYTALNSFKGDLLFSAGSLGYQVLGGLTAPIFQKHQLRSHYKIAAAAEKESYYAYEQTALNAYRDVINHLNEISSLSDIDTFKQQEVEALTRGVDIAGDLYITGYASYLEIVAAQKSKLEAELQLLAVKRKQVHAFINLYKALGGGWR